MSVYSIKDLEIVSGIKAHTIRIWEQRFGILTPKRTKTNIRYYDENQLCKLLNISSLIANGHKVSKIANYTNQEFNSHVDELIKKANPSNLNNKVFVNQLISSTITYNESLFNKLFNQLTIEFGIVKAFTEVIYPMLTQVGLMWNKQDILPSQEHFISNLIKRKLFAAIEDLPNSKINTESWLLMLPEDEEHEIGLLLSNYLLKINGKKTYYLGQRVPFNSVESFIDQYKPNAIHFFIIKKQSILTTQKLIDKIESSTLGMKICISGNDEIIKKLKLPKSFNYINSIDNFLELL